MEAWQEAAESSKIPRLPYKKILGMTLTDFVRLNINEKSREAITQEIKNRILIYQSDFISQISVMKALDNIDISISARYTEFQRRR